MTIKDKIRKLEYIRDNMYKESDRILKKYEKDITQLNYNQMSDGIGSDNKPLFNVLTQYTGSYRSSYKKEGLYDFFETGAFKKGLFAIISNNTAIVDSTGKGSGEKSLFFSSYTNIFGLDDYSVDLLRKKIMPELRAYLKSKS
jgi:hypothetical protein